MRRVSLAFLLLASVSMSAQNGAVDTLTLLPTPANELLLTPKIAGVTANVHNISLCQTYDHYLHDIPLSNNSDSYMRETSVVKKQAPLQSIQAKIEPGRK